MEGRFVLGDATQQEVLKHLRIEAARILVVAISDAGLLDALSLKLGA